MKKLYATVLSLLFIATCSITVFFLSPKYIQPTLSASPIDLSDSYEATANPAQNVVTSGQSADSEYQQKRAKLISLYKLGDPRLESTIM